MNTHSTSTVPFPGSVSKEPNHPNDSKVTQINQRSAGMFNGQSLLGGVLVVDDEPHVRKVIRLTLEKAGYYVAEAQDGEQAMQVLNEGEHPMVLDVIITDIRMPHINGLQAMTYFQREYPSIPLIVLTGFPELDMATGLLNRGIADYLVKPVEGEKLLEAVANAMKQRRINWF